MLLNLICICVSDWQGFCKSQRKIGIGGRERGLEGVKGSSNGGFVEAY